MPHLFTAYYRLRSESDNVFGSICPSDYQFKVLVCNQLAYATRQDKWRAILCYAELTLLFVKSQKKKKLAYANNCAGALDRLLIHGCTLFTCQVGCFREN